MKNGFTLIELLVIVIIMGIIVTITMPVMEDSVLDSRKKGFNSDVATISKAIEIYLEENPNFKFSSDGNASLEDLELEIEHMKNYTGKFSVVDDRITFNSVKNDEFCAIGTIEDLKTYSIDSEICQNS